MDRLTVALMALTAILLATAVPVDADEGVVTEDSTCVTIWTDPPGVEVDPQCVFEIIDDLPPEDSG